MAFGAITFSARDFCFSEVERDIADMNGLFRALLFLGVSCTVIFVLYNMLRRDTEFASLKDRFFITSLAVLLISCAVIPIILGSRDLSIMPVLLPVSFSGFLILFALVLFAKAQNRKNVMIVEALLLGMIFIGVGVFVACLLPVIYVILPCHYIFGWPVPKKLNEWKNMLDAAKSLKFKIPIPETSKPALVQQGGEVHKDKEAPVRELCFTVLGPSGAGKTTLLACMYHEFENMRSGMLVPNGQTSRVLERAYKALKNAANSDIPGFRTAIAGTENLRAYRFDVKGKGFSLPIRFFDFPGGWMDPDSKNYKMVMQIVKRSAAILVAVNTPYLMEEDGQYADQGLSSWTIQNILANSYEGGDRLILLIPIKCEKYTRTPDGTRQMLEKMKEKGIFKSTIGLMNNPTYKDMSMAILPIHTVGNAEFKAFKKDEEGKVLGEIYAKVRGKNFTPRDTDQPLRFVLSFLMKESLNKNILPGGIEELGDFIRQGMKLDDPNFEIIGGRDKLA